MFKHFHHQVGVFQCCFVLAVEVVGPRWRVFCGVVIEFFFVGGELLLALLAWWLRDWRKVQLAAVLPGFLFLSYYFLLPESVRWLVQAGRHREARAVVARVARGNGRPPLGEGELQQYRCPHPPRAPPDCTPQELPSHHRRHGGPR